MLGLCNTTQGFETHFAFCSPYLRPICVSPADDQMDVEGYTEQNEARGSILLLTAVCRSLEVVNARACQMSYTGGTGL